MRSARKRQCARSYKFPVMYVAGLILSGIFLQASHVSAATLTNRDDKEHKLTIIEEDGKTKADHVLKGNAVLENVCKAGCVVRLNDSEEDEYELEGTEVVSIEDGYLYYDGPDAPADNQPGTPAPGQPPAAPPPAKKN